MCAQIWPVVSSLAGEGAKTHTDSRKMRSNDAHSDRKRMLLQAQGVHEHDGEEEGELYRHLAARSALLEGRFHLFPPSVWTCALYGILECGEAFLNSTCCRILDRLRQRDGDRDLHLAFYDLDRGNLDGEFS